MPPVYRVLVYAWSVALAALWVPAAQAAQAATVLTRDFTAHTGVVSYADQQWRIRLPDGRQHVIAPAQFRAVRFAPTRTTSTTTSVLHLHNGTQLSGHLDHFRQGSPLVLKRLDRDSELALPLTAIHALEFPGLKLNAERQPRPDPPYIVMSDGRVIAGTVQWFTRRDINIQTAAGALTFKREAVKYIALSPPAPQPLQPGSEPRVLDVTTVHGEYIVSTLHQLDENELRVDMMIPQPDQTTTRERIVIARDSVLAIRQRAPLCTYLTALKPRRVRQHGYFTYHLPFHTNRNLWGQRLLLDQRHFAHGLALHSYCALTYDVPPRARRLTMTVGLDTARSDHGHGEFRVEAGGTILTTLTITGQTPRQTLTIELTGQPELTLIADFGDGGNSGDHIIIAEPVIAGEP